MKRLVAITLATEFAFLFCSFLKLVADDGDLHIQRTIIVEGDDQWDWTQARTARVDAGPRSLFLTTMSRTAKVGAHGYHDVFVVFGDSEGETWSAPNYNSVIDKNH